MSRKKNIFSMYRVLLLAVTLPLVAVLLGVMAASTKATSKEVKNLTKKLYAFHCGTMRQHTGFCFIQRGRRHSFL